MECRSTAARWTDFFVTIGGAAAALTGLFFVAVALRPREISRIPVDAGTGSLRVRMASRPCCSSPCWRWPAPGREPDRPGTAPRRRGRAHAVDALHARGVARRQPQLRPCVRVPRRLGVLVAQRRRSCAWSRVSARMKRSSLLPVSCCCLPSCLSNAAAVLGTKRATTPNPWSDATYIVRMETEEARAAAAARLRALRPCLRRGRSRRRCAPAIMATVANSHDGSTRYRCAIAWH